jgi:hypothetical protein
MSDFLGLEPLIVKPKYVNSGAIISPCGKYRYRLWREWRDENSGKRWRWLGFKDGAGHEVGEPLTCLFVMLNPSTADGDVDDPTIRRCVAFTKAWGYDRMEVVNLFAYRATCPADMLALPESADPVGWQNQKHVTDASSDAGKIVCAWGAHGSHAAQDETVLGWLNHPPRKLWCLGKTRAGHPKHPLYIRQDQPLETFSK